MFTASKLTFASKYSANPVWTFNYNSDFHSNYIYGIPSGTYTLTVLDGNFNQNQQFFTKQRMPWYKLPVDPNDETPDGYSEAQKFARSFSVSPTGLNFAINTGDLGGREVSYTKPNGVKVRIVFAVDSYPTQFPQDVCNGGLEVASYYYDGQVRTSGFSFDYHPKCADDAFMSWPSNQNPVTTAYELKYAVLL